MAGRDGAAASSRAEGKGAHARASAAVRAVRRPQERSGETRTRLVTCAVEAISELGYTAATTPVIADRAGVSRGALQYHFASRADLDLAVIDFVASELNFRFDVDAISRLALPERVAAVVENYFQTFTSPVFRAALNVWLGVVTDPPVAQRLRDHLSVRQDRIEQTWKTLFKDTGRLPAELTAIRHIVMGAARGFAVERFFHPEATGASERAMLCTMTLHALTQPPTKPKSARQKV